MRKHLEDVEITAIDSRGRGRGSAIAGDGTTRPVFVMGAYPGDHVDVRVRRRKSGAYLGDVLAFREGSGDAISRVQPFCRHFYECGGCTLQDTTYADQLRYKEAIVTAAFRELYETIPDSELPPFQEILPAPRERRYRNKLEYSFGAQRWLSDEEIARSETIEDRRGFGFHAPGRFDRVVDVTECYLQPEPSETIRAFVRERALQEGWSFYDSREHIGLLRLMTIRTS
jgi:23S rRNA (uracil1939-C5)-methyltransferase